MAGGAWNNSEVVVSGTGIAAGSLAVFDAALRPRLLRDAGALACADCSLEASSPASLDDVFDWSDSSDGAAAFFARER